MEQVDDIILGAGITGLAYARALIEATARSGGRTKRPLILEREATPGGAFRTIRQDGFRWDCGAQLLQLKDEALKTWFNLRIDGRELSLIEMDCRIRFAGQDIRAPFKDKIDELPRALLDASFLDEAPTATRCSYPVGGAEAYIRALLSGLPEGCLCCGEEVRGVDLVRKVLSTDKRQLRFQRLVSTIPLRDLLMWIYPLDCIAISSCDYTKVLLFNLGFDRAATHPCHWMYFPERAYSFYRVGWHNNLRSEPRMSLCVELSLPGHVPNQTLDIPALRERVLAELREAGIVTDQQLISVHHALIDPAYPHEDLSEDERRFCETTLNAAGVFSIGRYGSWRRKSGEACVQEARQLARYLSVLAAAATG